MAKLAVTFFLIAGLLPAALDSKLTDETQSRNKRQVPSLNPLIPNSIGHYTGSSQSPIDKCPRDEVLFSDGNCYNLLTQGPCSINEYLILNPRDNSPYCVERLCFPDRIFVFSDQLCHDPRTTTLCPPGRELYETMYGTPVCQCPDGTYEGDDDLDDDVCEPLLGQTPNCPPGQIFWFRDFSLPPECLPDPCGGDNLNRGPNDQPFVPFSDGRCFQLGTMPNVCPAQTWYSIALEQLQGVCSTLEDAGYQVFDPNTLNQLIEIYGPPITRDSTAPIPVPVRPGVGAGPGRPLGVTTPTGSTGITTGNIITNNPGSNTVGPGSTVTLGKPDSKVVAGQLVQGISGPVTTGNQGLLTQGISNQQGILSQSFNAVSPGSIHQGGSTGSSVTAGQGLVNPNFVVGSQGNFVDGIGLGNNIPYQQITGQSGVLSSGAGQNPGTVSHGISRRPSLQTHRFESGSQGTFGQGVGAGSQMALSQGIHSQGAFSRSIASHGNFDRGPSIGMRMPFTQGIGNMGIHRGTGSAINFQGSHSRPGYSPRPTNPFGGAANVMQPFHGSSPLIISPGHSSATEPIDQSQEMFMYDDDGPVFRTGDIDITGIVDDLPDINIQEAELLANINVPLHLSTQQEFGGSAREVSLLQAPRDHKLHGFFNSVRELVHNGPHNRSRRSPQPHAAPGNVFETRLVGCRAGAARDINAKCRNTVLPARTPASRPARAAPPVPPRRGCPSGQSFNIQRMCVGSGNAVDSINAFNLGK